MCNHYHLGVMCHGDLHQSAASGSIIDLFSILFADDTNVFCSGKQLDKIIFNTNEELSKLLNWMDINKLSLNVKKNYVDRFKSKREMFTFSISVY